MKCPKCESLEKENLELLSKLRLLTKIGDTIAQDLRVEKKKLFMIKPIGRQIEFV
jgi:hypothetical protein